MPISIPKFFQKAFAQNGGRQDVPVTGDTSGGRASYDVGFPPQTRTPIIAGGIPPFGTDFNGVLYDLSQAIQYLQSGVSFPFDQDFADAIGGYSVKAIVADPSDPTILWQNNNANNTLPPSVPNGWTQVFSAAELVRDPTELLRGAPLQSSQSQAETGTNNTAMMTALRVFQAMRSTAANATEALRGTTLFASAAENAQGTAQNKAVDPLGLREAFNASGTAPVFAIRAWAKFNGSTVGTNAPTAGGNIASIQRVSTGVYSVLFATPMPDADYDISGSASTTATNNSRGGVVHPVNGTITANGFTFITAQNSDNGTVPSILDYAYVSVHVIK